MDSTTLWIYSLAAGVVVVAVVALLLILIIRAANRIDDSARHIWQAGQQIAANTVSIWMLQTTNVVASDILATAKSIASVAGGIHKKIDDLGRVILKPGV
jgi:hypothetical protein